MHCCAKYIKCILFGIFTIFGGDYMSGFEWNSHSNITIQGACRCIEEQVFTVQDIKVLGCGFDNVAFLVNHTFIFRFPRHQTAYAYQLNYENLLLQKLQNLGDLKIPHPIYFGVPTNNYPYHFQGYELIEGKAGYEVDLSEDELQSCLKSLAHFLKKLHSVSVEQAQKWGLKKSGYDQTNVNTVIEILQQRVQSIIENNVFDIDQEFIRDEIEWAKKTNPIPHSADCLTHSDLHFKHLIIHNKKLVGIIDWGDVDINHPVIDFAIIYEMFPVYMHGLFFDIYGVVDQDICRYARLLALKSLITSMLYGYDTKDQVLFNAAVKSYKRLKN